MRFELKIDYVSAIGKWKQAQSSKEDPHTLDLTGSAIVTGNFYQDNKTHFAMGSPKADKLYGKVYICYDCFNTGRNFKYTHGREVCSKGLKYIMKGF